MENKVKVGDKIKVVKDTWAASPVGTICTVRTLIEEDHIEASVDDSDDDFAWYFGPSQYEIVTDTPKLWRDMAPEEKGALLLAHHEGKVIECIDPCDYCDEWEVLPAMWLRSLAYRVRPERTTRRVMLAWVEDDGSEWHEIGSINLIDGKPDQDSIRMEEIE